MLKEDMVIALQWLELFQDFQRFNNKHFANDGFDIYKNFIENLKGYHYLEIHGEKILEREHNEENVYYDLLSARIVGSDRHCYIKIEYTMDSCSVCEIIACYLVEEKEITIKKWERV